MTDTDHVAVRTFADVWRDSNVRNGTDLHLNLGVVDGDVVSLNEPQLRAALDELERLRVENAAADDPTEYRAWLEHQLQLAYRSGWDDRGENIAIDMACGGSHKSEAAAKAYVDRFRAAQLAADDSAPQQPERDSDADGAR